MLREREAGRGGVWTGAPAGPATAVRRRARREDAGWGARPGANRDSTVKTPSLRLRVVVGVLVLLAAVLVGLGLLVNAVLAARLEGDLRDRLAERAGFARLVAARGLPDQELADRLTGQGITAVVRDGGAEVFGRSRPDGPGRRCPAAR